MPNRDEYELLEACILSEQVPLSDIAKMMSSDRAFAEWLRARASLRQRTIQQPVTQGSAADNTSLIALAAWLHRLAEQARVAGMNDDAERFQLASDIVKEAADRNRAEHEAAVQRPATANEG
jgi:hypothetical protein